MNDLHLAILREIEAHQPPGTAFEIEIAGYSQEEVSAAVYELHRWGDIEARSRRRPMADTQSPPTRWVPTRLTAKGRAILDANK